MLIIGQRKFYFPLQNYVHKTDQKFCFTFYELYLVLFKDDQTEICENFYYLVTKFSRNLKFFRKIIILESTKFIISNQTLLKINGPKFLYKRKRPSSFSRLTSWLFLTSVLLKMHPTNFGSSFPRRSVRLGWRWWSDNFRTLYLVSFIGFHLSYKLLMSKIFSVYFLF